jgi:WD40 repeat protein
MSVRRFVFICVLSGSEDKTLMVWDVSTGQPIRRLEGHTSGVTSLTFSPDGKTVVSGAHDGLLILWDIGTGTAIRQFKGHTEDVTGIVFTPDGRSIISTGDWTIRHWDIETGASLFDHRSDPRPHCRSSEKRSSLRDLDMRMSYTQSG